VKILAKRKKGCAGVLEKVGKLLQKFEFFDGKWAVLGG
jgi:hypothetical protein